MSQKTASRWFLPVAFTGIAACGPSDPLPHAQLAIASSVSAASLAPESPMRIGIHVEGGRDSVALAAENLPAGVAVTFDNATVLGTSDTEATLSAMPGAIPGLYPIVLRATDAERTAATRLDLSVEVKDDFSVVLAPSSTTLRPGASVGVGVSILRRGRFEDPVDITVSEASGDLSASPLVVPAQAGFGVLNLKARASAGRVDRTLVVRASHPKLGERTAPLSVHLQPEGSLDTSFGPDGTVAFTPYHMNAFGGAAVQADGKIVVSVGVNPALSSTPSIVVVRFMPDGSLDPSFGTAGSALVRPSVLATDWLFPRAVTVAPDGKILVAGSTTRAEHQGYVVRLLPSGALDLSFGQGGCFRREGQERGFYPTSIHLHAGRILIGGVEINSPPSYRYDLWAATANGALDPTFGDGGMTRLTLNDSSSFLEVVGGKLVLAGGTFYDERYGTGDIFVTRFTADGLSDATFGLGGAVTVDYSGTGDRAVGVAAQPDGKLVVVGRGYPSLTSRPRITITRLLTSGALDPTFAENGRMAVPTLDEYATSMVLQKDGRIVVGCNVGQDFGVVRFTSDGRLDQSFGVAGRISLPGPDFITSRAFVLADGRLLFVRDKGSGISLTRIWP